MSKLFYCHLCTHISAIEGERICPNCLSDFIEEIQEEDNCQSLNENDNIETDGESIPIPESSGLKEAKCSLIVPQFQYQETFSSPSSSENKSISTASSISYQKEDNLSGLSHFVDVNIPKNPQNQNFIHGDIQSNIAQVSISEPISTNNSSIVSTSLPTEQSTSSITPPKSIFQMKDRLSGLFRNKSKADKFTNKISIQLINFSSRDDCSICLKTYQTKDFVRITQCGHKYHDTCLKSWLKVKKECPICRSQFQV